jgi:hypothetical protein
MAFQVDSGKCVGSDREGENRREGIAREKKSDGEMDRMKLERITKGGAYWSRVYQ